MRVRAPRSFEADQHKFRVSCQVSVLRLRSGYLASPSAMSGISGSFPELEPNGSGSGCQPKEEPPRVRALNVLLYGVGGGIG